MTYNRRIDGLYPVGENAPERVRTKSGRPFSDLSLESLIAGELAQEDLSITPEALRLQAEIARRAGREPLAQNFERAAEMASIPTETVLDIYESLRPGRTKDKQALFDMAEMLEETYGARLIADFIREAAVAYDKRGIFRFRY